MTKKIKPMLKLGFKDGITIIFAVFLFALFIKNSSLASTEVIKVLKICAQMLIPTLFPLAVASEIITEIGAVEKLTDKISAPIAKILGVNKIATVPYFLGLFGGYTSSCKSAITLYKSGKISKGDCESIIALSNIPSLAFFTGFVGIGIFKSSTIGWVLWIIAIISTLVLGLINKCFFKKNEQIYCLNVYNKKSSKSFAQIVVDAIAHSAYAMLIICACVVFFSVLISVLSIYLSQLAINEQVQSIMLGTLEITNGIRGCTNIENTFFRAVICAFLIGWSGLCVHFQVIAICEETDISFKKYFIFKGLQGIICTLLAFLFWRFKF